MTHAQRNAAILKLLKERTARATVSKEAARAMLFEDGIYRKDGTLRAKFGGTSKKKNAAA